VSLLLSALLAAVAAHEHKCIHDKLAAARANRGHYSAGEQNYAYEGRRLQAQTWSPIRILPVYDPNFGTDSYFSSGTPSWIRNTLVPTALDRCVVRRIIAAAERGAAPRAAAGLQPRRDATPVCALPVRARAGSRACSR